MKKITYLFILLFTAISLISCGDKPTDPIAKTEKIVSELSLSENTKPSCGLTMGWDPWAPYQYLSPDNQVNGLEIDLISSIAKQAGCSITFVQGDWMNLLKGIREGTVDLLGGASKTPQRAEFAAFSDPYRHESFVLYIRTEQKKELGSKSLPELLKNGFRLGVTEDYIYGDKVAAFQDDSSLTSQIVTVPVTEVNYYNLTQHQIDGFLEDPFVAAYTIRRKGLSDQIEATSIEVASGDVSIMFSKESVPDDVIERFNQGLAAIKASGEYQIILDKYRR